MKTIISLLLSTLLLSSLLAQTPPADSLAPETTTDEVEITYRRQGVEVRPDRTILNIASLPGTAGSTAWDLLRRTPGVTVASDNSLRLQGKTDVAIWINDRPSLLGGSDLVALLQGIPANEVATIEVMTQPGAQYDAAGSGGIILFRLTRPLHTNRGGSLTTSLMQGLTPKGQTSLTLFAQGKAVASQLTLGMAGGQQANWTRFYRVQGDSTYDQRNDQVSTPWNPSVRVAADWKPRAAHTFGLSLDGRGGFRGMDGTAVTAISANGQAPARTLTAVSEQQQRSSRVLAGAFHRYADTSGFSWQTDLDAYLFDKEADMMQDNVYVSSLGESSGAARIRTGMPTHIRTGALRSDLALPKRAYGTLGLGAKLTGVMADNDFRFDRMQPDGLWRNDTARSNAFAYREALVAAYASWSHSWKAWEAEAGLRWEHTSTLGTLSAAAQTSRVLRQYPSLFPSVAVVRTFKPGNSLRLGLNRRIDRPPYADLNPFVYQSDELTYSQGNPFLRPQFASQAELGWTWKYKFQVKASYTLTTDVFAQITDTFDARSSIMTQQNMASRRTWSLDASLPITVRKGWDVYASLSAYHTRYAGEWRPGETIVLEVNAFNVYLQHQIQLPRRMLLELSGYYNSPYLWEGTYRSRQFWGTEASLQKQLKRDGSTLTLTLSDVMHSMTWRGVSDLPGLSMDARGGWESRQLRLTWTQPLSKGKNAGLRSRAWNNREEMQRVP